MILASASPRRSELLRRLNRPFKVINSQVEEVLDLALPMSKIVQQLAYQKAMAVFKQYPNELIIAGDTIVVIDHEILGKPKQVQQAQAMLQKLNGRVHQVMSGVCLMNQNKTITFCSVSHVALKKVDEEVINHYIEYHQPFDKAGSYGIQDVYFKEQLLDSYEGDYETILGLPLSELKTVLERNFND